MPPEEEDDRFGVAFNSITPDYFATIRQPLLRGRDFTEQDRLSSPAPVIVNEAMAKRYWPNEEALGKRMFTPGDQVGREVIGVAANARSGSFGGEIQPLIYSPADSSNFLTLHVRASNTATQILPEVARLARELDPNVAVARVTTMRDDVSQSLLVLDVVRSVLGIAGVLALAPASLGLFGLVSYALEQRIKEMGVRVALGATRRQVLQDISGGAVKLASIGIVIGLALAAAVMRFAAAYLYGLSPADPFTFGVVAIVLLAVTLAAAYAASRKALNVDPVVALRHD